VGHIGGELLVAEQGIEQAGFTHPHPAKYRHPGGALLQALQLAIEGGEFGAQGVLFAGGEGEVAAPLAQQ
jgi:hypothetical protein